MPTLSVVMIVKDEAHRIAGCLNSVRAIADEIVVADTGSTDDTLVRVAEFGRRGIIPRLLKGAKVFSIPWHDDFAEARNQTLAAASGDWLLHLDADEMLDAGGARRIRAIVDADGFGADAIEVTLANYCDDMRAWRWVPVPPDDPMARGKAGYVAAPLLRLFRNRRGFEYREAIHENITESVVEHGGVIRQEPILIHHYGYATDSETSGVKAALYYRIARNKARERPGDPKAWHDLAEQALSCGDTVTAEDACRHALELTPMNLAASTTLATILLNRGDVEEAWALLDRLERAGITAPHISVALGAIAYKQGRMDEARQRFEAVLETPPNHLQALLYLARTLEVAGQVEAAREQLQRARALAPGIEELHQRIEAHDLRVKAESQFQTGDIQAALQTLVEALRLDNEDPLIHNDLGVLLMTMGQSQRAAEAFQRALLLARGMTCTQENLAALQGK